jgi:hypothetical protein
VVLAGNKNRTEQLFRRLSQHWRIIEIHWRIILKWDLKIVVERIYVSKQRQVNGYYQHGNKP